jgi:hypothetical protein
MSEARRGPGRPPKPERKYPDIAFQLPDGDYEYLQYVVRVMHQLADTENDAAKFILIREIDKMRRKRYHERRPPITEPIDASDDDE